MNNKEITRPWQLWKLISFRFVLLYFILRASLWTLIPFIGSYFYKFYYYPSFFLQNYILQLNDPNRWEHPPTGSGDTLDDWMLSLAYIILSLILTIIWLVFDRKRKEYNKLYNYFTIGLRYYLAMVMFSYGISKLFVNQMPYPSIAQFYTPLGELTPMRLTWLHLGYSAPYQFFGGFMETLGGLLILFRRTQLLGLFVLIGVMGNVFLLNLFYGVPVKLFSFFLVLIILYLLFQYRNQLVNLLLNKSTQPITIPNYFDEGWKRYLRIGLKFAFLAYYFGNAAYEDYSWKKERQERPALAIEGAFDVELFSTNGELNNAPTDTTRWNRIVISPGYSRGSGRGHITKGTSNFRTAGFYLDSLMNFIITSRKDTLFLGKVIKEDENNFLLKGNSGLDTLELKLQRNEREFTLDKRKFMWVMEQKDF